MTNKIPSIEEIVQDFYMRYMATFDGIVTITENNPDAMLEDIRTQLQARDAAIIERMEAGKHIHEEDHPYIYDEPCIECIENAAIDAAIKIVKGI